MTDIVMFSGGAGSWAAARRVAERRGTENLLLVFADTLIEDEDLYRFLDEAAADVGGELVRLSDGRTPWQVFRDVRYLGNTRVDPCSNLLKRKLIRDWIEENYEPDECVVYLGIDWTEEHRFTRARDRWLPYTVEAPLCEPPIVTKQSILREMKDAGIQPPRLYDLGFPHNNCGGFCVKAGMAHFKLLLETMPERYAEHEAEEEALREYLGKPVTVLRDRSGGDTTPISMREFRERVQRNEPTDLFDWGGCGCFMDDDRGAP